MLVPACMLFLLINTIPFFYGLVLSFTDKNYYKPTGRGFIGLANYIKLLRGANDFYRILVFTIIYTVGTVLISYAVGMLYAWLLNRDIRLRNLFRVFALLPWLVPSAVMAINWQWLLNDQFGFFNGVLMNLGLISKPVPFIANPQLARLTVMIVSIWRTYPFMMVMLLGGMQSIGKEQYEPADIDGANGWQKFYYITLPLLRPVSLVAITLQFIWTFNAFDNIFLLTRGGPVNATYVLSIETYNAAFYRGNIGYASAVALTSAVLIIIVYLVYRIMKKFRKHPVY